MLLARRHQVIALDIIPDKVDLLNQGISPVEDKEIQEYLAVHREDLTLNVENSNLKKSFTATLDHDLAFKGANFVIVATPTNYDSAKNYFDTSSVEIVVQDIIILLAFFLQYRCRPLAS